MASVGCDEEPHQRRETLQMMTLVMKTVQRPDSLFVRAGSSTYSKFPVALDLDFLFLKWCIKSGFSAIFYANFRELSCLLSIRVGSPEISSSRRWQLLLPNMFFKAL